MYVKSGYPTVESGTIIRHLIIAGKIPLQESTSKKVFLQISGSLREPDLTKVISGQTYFYYDAGPTGYDEPVEVVLK